ncbi:MAG: hypothetical protein JWM47_2696 [Acidimicrobiales bacterium]|nr:hypothetical protein [Acidimicrobiales bacterium]
MSSLPVLHHPLHVGRPVLDGTVPTRSTARRRLVLAMAAVTAAAEVATVAGALPTLSFGSLPLPLSILPAVGLALVAGERLLGRSTARRAAIGYWVAIAVLLPVIALLYVRDGRFALFTSLAAASASEELVYRLAIPAVLAIALRFARVRPDRARVASLALAGLWFVVLPGHREQMHSLASALPFVAYAALAAVLVHRSGSVLPVAAGHVVINLLTVLVWNETVAADARGMALACLLGLLAVAYGRPEPITIGDDGSLIDTRTGLAVTTIDLRDGYPATVTLADGTSRRVATLHHDAPPPLQARS